MIRWLSSNIRTLLLALTLAIAVWVSAVSAADPNETREYPNSIPIEFIGQDPGLVTVGELPRTVRLTLRAPNSVWETLMEEENSIHAVADLAGFEAGNHIITIQIQITASPVRILEVTPASFEVKLEPLITQTLPITLAYLGDPATGYLAGEVVIEPGMAIVSGPESVINRVAGVSATLDLTGARQNVNTSIPLNALDTDGAVLSGVSLHPANVQVILPVVQLGGYRDLAVKVVTYGRPANGYRLTGISPIPAVVTVFSEDAALINSLPGYLETSALDLTGKNADIDAILSIVIPPGVFIVGEPAVQVYIGITPIESSLTLTNQGLTPLNLGEGLQARIAPERVDVILTGPLPTLNSLQVTDLRVVLDLTDLQPGTHHITPHLEISIQDIVVESILPGTVEVVISEASTPIP